MINEQVLPKIDYSKYFGEWVVISNDKIIGHNKDLRKLDDKINNCKTIPTIARIPKSNSMIF